MSELTAAHSTIEKAREVTNCPADVDLQDHLKALVAEVHAAKAAYEIIRHLNVNREEANFCGIDDCFIDDAVAAMVTPVADSILRAIEAQGVEKFGESTIKIGEEEGDEDIVYAGKQAMLFAKQLREGKA